MSSIYNDKIVFFKDVIDNIQFGLLRYKNLNILSSSEYKSCYECLEKIINIMINFNNDNVINELQFINNTLSSLIKNYGIYNFKQLIDVCLGADFIDSLKLNENFLEKYEIIKKYLHPINYKIINWENKENKLKSTKKIYQKEIIKNKIVDDKQIIEDAEMFECFDLMRTSTNFNIRVYGIKVIIHDYSNKKTLTINCIYDDVMINNIDSSYLLNKKKGLIEYINENNMHKNEMFVIDSWKNYFDNLNIKDYLVYNNTDLFNKYIFIMTQVTNMENKNINCLVQDFMGSELFNQRSILIHLLLNNHKQEFQYIAYLLYDLLSNETSDSNEQKILYDSLSWNCKKYFKDAMCKTIEYTTHLSNFENNKIPLEQQICLMKASDNIKEKAMQKLKELKSKSEDSGSKARQYLDGLLKIPFGIYKEEYILYKKNDIINLFKLLTENIKLYEDINIENTKILVFINLIKEMINKDDYNLLEILNIINVLSNELYNIYNDVIQYIFSNVFTNKKKILLHIINSINNISQNFNITGIKQTNNITNINSIRNNIKTYLEKNKSNKDLMRDILLLIETQCPNQLNNYLINIDKSITKINYKNNEIINYISSFNNILDGAIHGHKNAKNQIERIIGQWINGEKTGYCFGFEGPPGVGKTSLAKKGIANCLKDIDGQSRPFAFIALGGSSNGSILDGHNYTYVGSTWGKIVDILIENKCMNPIIFIDELDKVSRTEHGKEIIGILTHLIDSTQNDTFQDKYFSNIDLDLSKALFIFSYNDVELIDKILLDRIHRIKFENLNLDDKLTICEDYLLPELYKKFGVENIFNFDRENMKYIIEKFTNEPGVRKLKEILFEIISSINLELLKKTNKYTIPVVIDTKIIDEILHERHTIKHLKINTVPKVGIINGMWANAYGNGGILHIESKLFFTSTFLDLKLTGMQGDVMKESMTVAKTLALSLITKSSLKKTTKEFEETKMQGIHIHVPEGATPKDGPSAGAAITTVIYSLLTNKKIRHNIAITGEICLQGKITAIGGLDLKILGGIRAGVDTFIYPTENAKDFNLFYEKYSSKIDGNGYKFIEVDNIHDAMKHILI